LGGRESREDRTASSVDSQGIFASPEKFWRTRNDQFDPNTFEPESVASTSNQVFVRSSVAVAESVLSETFSVQNMFASEK
jgi:hypothetical protein